MRLILVLRLLCLLVLVSTAAMVLAQESGSGNESKKSSERARNGWRTADRSSAGIAPLPDEAPEAVVQVYAARAYGWRGYFGVHSWIAVKAQNAPAYTTYHGLGFRLERRGSIVVISEEVPDRRWYGSEPVLVSDLRGDAAARAIPAIHAAALDYPDAQRYHVWPGPNSNTLIAHIIRHTPELGVELPPNAIGKDWFAHAVNVVRAESGTGVQVSVFGLLGVTMGAAEGIEFNHLGLAFGVDVLRPAIKLPFVGRLGMRDAPVFWKR